MSIVIKSISLLLNEWQQLFLNACPSPFTSLPCRHCPRVLNFINISYFRFHHNILILRAVRCDMNFMGVESKLYVQNFGGEFWKNN